MLYNICTKQLQTTSKTAKLATFATIGGCLQKNITFLKYLLNIHSKIEKTLIFYSKIILARRT